jgi:protein-S-isoprenylcysteine O-methyltransferase Ste14
MPDLPAPGPATRIIVWLGGAAFVISLAVTLVGFYVGMQPAPAGADAAVAALVDTFLFSVFALHHSLFARSGIKRWMTTHVPPHLERSLYVWTASLLLIAVVASWRPLPGRVYHHDGWAAIPHWLVVLVGLWLTATATKVIDGLQLAGIRQGLRDGGNDGFQIVGPYHFIRHPIYLGWMLMVFGVPDLTWTRFVFAAVSSAYLIVAIPFEERSLIEAFGDTYKEYQRRVRWRVVPGIW